MMLVAPTRTGKGRDILIPCLLTFRGSCIVIDPKGQLAAVTKRQRAKFGPVFVLNPFNILPDRLGNQSPDRKEPACYNPEDLLDPASDAFTADSDTIAEAIVTHDGKGESHWPDSARQLVSGFQMRLASDPGYAHLKNLAFVRDRVTKNPYRFAREVREVVEAAEKAGKDVDPIVSLVYERLARFAEADAHMNKEISSIISTANTQTAFLSIKAIANSLSHSDLRFRQLKREPTTVYIILPQRYLKAASKWFRVIIQSALHELLQEPGDGEDIPTLAVLDEFTQLGHLQAIEDAMALAAGFGLQLFLVAQDVNKLQETYPSYKTLLANADVQLFYAPREIDTAKLLSDLSGEKEVVVPSEQVRELSQKEAADGFTGLSLSWARTTVPLLRPHEIMQLAPAQNPVPADSKPQKRERYLRFVDGRMLPCVRLPYYDTKDLEGLYDADPYHRTRA
jgi:type IV secretion system protein VirD4